MKKYITALFLLITAAAFSQTKETYDIGILLDFRTPELKPLLSRLQAEIVSVVGEDAIVQFSDENILVNEYNLEKAENNYNVLLTNNTDIIIAFGAVNNEFFSKIELHKKPTILFGAVTNNTYELNSDKKTSGVNNFTYLLTPLSYSADLGMLQELTGFEHVGIAVEEGILEVMSFDKVFDGISKELGFSFELIPYKGSEEILNRIDATKLDAFYLVGGITLGDAAIASITAKLLEEKIPSFTSTGITDVENGLLATNRSLENISLFFRRIALNIEAFVNGENLSDLPLFLEFRNRLTLNINTAKILGIPIKYSLIGNANIIGDLKNPISEIQYDLLDVMKAVVGENLNLKSSRKDIELSEQDVRTAKSNYFPSITGSANFNHVDPDLAATSLGNNPEFSTAGNISLEQVVYSPAANAGISIQKDLLGAQREVYNSNELDAIFNASNAYFNALILKANLSIQNKNLNLTRKNLEIATQNFEAGQTGKSDVLRFTSEKAQNKQALVEAVNQLQQAYYSLNQLLNNPIGMEIDVDEAELGEGVLANYNYRELKEFIDSPTLREPFIDYLVDFAIKNSPDLKSLDYNLSATERNIQLNSSGRFIPTAAIQGQYNHTFGRSGAGSTAPEGLGFDLIDNSYNVGLNLSIPIVNRNQTNINRQIGEIQQDQLRINRENIQLNIHANIKGAILNLYNQIANIEISKISEEAAKESLELVQESYFSGAVNIVQLLDAQNNFLQAQQAKVTAVYGFLASSIELERYLSYFFLLHTPDENQAFLEGFYEYVQTRN
jgi:outer membrane protein TolC